MEAGLEQSRARNASREQDVVREDIGEALFRVLIVVHTDVPDAKAPRREHMRSRVVTKRERDRLRAGNSGEVVGAPKKVGNLPPRALSAIGADDHVRGIPK